VITKNSTCEEGKKMKEKITFPHIYHCSVCPGDKVKNPSLGGLQGQIALLFPSAAVGAI